MRYKLMKVNLWLVGLLIVGLTSCAVTDLDRTANFDAYKSFFWGKSDVKVENPLYESDLIHKNIKNTIEQEFAKRGITKKKHNPDLLVSYHTYTEQKEHTTGRPYFGSPFYYSYRFMPYMYGWGWPFPYGYGIPQTETYTEGTLIIDILDVDRNEVVWRGSVAGKIDDAATLQKQIGKGIRAIMKKYPVTQDSAPLSLEKKEDV